MRSPPMARRCCRRRSSRTPSRRRPRRKKNRRSSARTGCQRTDLQREAALIGLGVIIGSLVLVALAELCRPRRRREFPALRRRLGNIGFWILNLVLAALIFEPAARFRPAVDAGSGISFSFSAVRPSSRWFVGAAV